MIQLFDMRTGHSVDCFSLLNHYDCIFYLFFKGNFFYKMSGNVYHGRLGPWTVSKSNGHGYLTSSIRGELHMCESGLRV